MMGNDGTMAVKWMHSHRLCIPMITLCSYTLAIAIITSTKYTYNTESLKIV
jgi:hypothetical protein